MKPIIDFLNDKKIKYYFDKSEYLINYNGNTYFYDLTIQSLKIIIEYQSSTWHAYPLLNENEWGNVGAAKGQ